MQAKCVQKIQNRLLKHGINAVLFFHDQTCKPSSVVYGHLSRLAVAGKLKRYSRYLPDGQPYMADTQSCSGWGLHGIPRYRSIGELLPRLSILTEQSPAVYFCCTFLEVAFTWRYQAPCPVLLGLSSWSRRTPRPYNKLKSLYIIAHLTKKVLLFQQKNSKI